MINCDEYHLNKYKLFLHTFCVYPFQLLYSICDETNVYFMLKCNFKVLYTMQ